MENTKENDNLVVQIPLEMKEELKRLAKNIYKVSLSDVVRWALGEWLESQEEEQEAPMP